MFLEYAKKLKFEDKPQYSNLRNLLKEIAIKNSIDFNYNKFDWIIKKNNNKKDTEKNDDDDDKSED